MSTTAAVVYVLCRKTVCTYGATDTTVDNL